MGARPAQGADAAGREWAVALDYVRAKKVAEESLGFLTACGEELARTLDCAASLRRVGAMCVPFLAAWCRIAVHPAGAAAPGFVTTHRAPHVGQEQATRFAAFLLDESPVARYRLLHVGARREPVAYSESEGLAGRCDAATLTAAGEHGIGSALLLPIASRGALLGTFALVRTREREQAGPATLALSVELCRRVAAAVEIEQLRARLPAESRARQRQAAGEAG